ncbi:MAG: hypothetical protein K1X83_15355, partial [Oligoflexia bacterium]|nr:hypothetical protein [Oligoflexia bacterium]
MKRRTFLGFCVSALGIAALARLAYVKIGAQELVKELVRQRLPFLEIETQALNDFSAAVAKTSDAAPLLGLSALYFIRRLSGDRSAHDETLSKWSDKLAEQFLLSSDFFLNPEQKAKVTQYIGLYDPYSRVCSNPFSAH